MASEPVVLPVEGRDGVASQNQGERALRVEVKPGEYGEFDAPKGKSFQWLSALPQVRKINVTFSLRFGVVSVVGIG